MRTGPVIIGFDGTPVAERAVREAARLLAPRPAIVVFVWEAGRAFDLIDVPSRGLDWPLGNIEVRGFAADRAMADNAELLAGRGTALAAECGLDARGMAVAEDGTVADTIVRLTEELDAAAVALGAHNRGRISELLLGSTSRAVLRHASCPVVVIRGEN